MAPHQLVLVIGLAVLAVLEVLVYLDSSRDAQGPERRGGAHTHQLNQRLQPMP